MRSTTQRGDVPGLQFSGFVYAISIAFPSWGGLLAGLYMLICCGVSISALREFWRGL